MMTSRERNARFYVLRLFAEAMTRLNYSEDQRDRLLECVNGLDQEWNGNPPPLDHMSHNIYEGKAQET
jgi:hypothetical protein